MAGWTQWGIGQVVEATDFQGYIQDQVVQVYTDSTARGSALGTAVSAGMMSYLTASTALQYYNGSAWANVSQIGDITAVTAGTGLTGGGVSGDVTLNVDYAAVGSAVLASPNMTGTAVMSNANITGSMYVYNILNIRPSGNAAFEIGTNGTSSTPFIDFHSGATFVDYDSRIIASGGNGTSGNGSLTIQAAGLTLPSNTSIGSVSATEIGYLDGVTSAVQTQLNAKADFTQTVSGKTSAYTAVASDANDLIYVSSGTVTVTIPDVLAIGDRIDILRDSSGTVTIAAGTGVTSWGGAGTAGTAVTFKIDQQYNAATVYKVAAATYRVIGRIVA